MGYYSNVNPELLALIPPDAKTVLEIGCGEGALCEAYRRVNPGVEWHGLDKNSAVYLVAENRLNSIDIGDIEDQIEFDRRDCGAYFDVDHENWYDVLILGDILEHLREPWAILKRLAMYIKPGAQCLACIPNVQHWTVIRDLLNGKWEYTDSGLLDRTHLRFFTLDSIRAMFKQAGLQVYEIIGRDICNEGFDEWLNDSEVTFAKEMKAYQYIVRAIKPNVHCTITKITNGVREVVDSGPAQQIPKLHLHAVTAEECCARPRIHEPFAMLRTIPRVKCTTGPFIHHETNVAILQRPRFPTIDSLAVLKGCLERNQILIAEIDDLPDEIGIPACALKAFHAIQVSTEPLAEYCRKQNPNVMVFENQIAELPPWEDKSRETLRIFFGAQNRYNDWLPIRDAINRVIADTHHQIRFVVVHDNDFYLALNTDNKEFHSFCEYTKYRELLRSCDIALLPLEDTPFNQCKSDIKFLECAAEGVAVLAGRTVYFDSMFSRPPTSMGMFYDSRFCKGGKFYNSLGDGIDEFEMALRHLIDETEWRQKYVECAYAYVKNERLLSQHYHERYMWYQNLIHSKQALDRQLLERVPELSEHLVKV